MFAAKHAQTLTLWALSRILVGVKGVKISPVAILNRTNYTVRQKYKTIMEYVALTFAIIAFPLAIGAYYRIDKLEKELKAKNLIANDFDSNK